jgi:RNA polymerase sigma-70 factor (ECF subfamily)
MDLKEEDDPERLLGRARAGETAALGRLLEKYRGYLALLARQQIGRRIQGKASSSDLVQETFLRAHRDFAAFRGKTEAEFAAWLRQILAASLGTLLRRYLGTKRRDPRLERELVVELDHSSRNLERHLVAPTSTPGHKASRREQAVRLAQALERLPAHYREVIVLHHLEGLSLSQMAQRLDRTPDSVEKLWARALIQLRRLLGDSP